MAWEICESLTKMVLCFVMDRNAAGNPRYGNCSAASAL
jgi:hypothetical protein